MEEGGVTNGKETGQWRRQHPQTQGWPVGGTLAVILINLIMGDTMLFGIAGQDFNLRRDLSRSVFAKQCAIRIDKQQKERYNNVVIDNDVII